MRKGTEIKPKRSHWVECREDEVLTVHWTQCGPNAVGGIALASFYSLILAGTLMSAPFVAKVPLSREQIALDVGAGFAILAIGHALAFIIYLRAKRGVWTVDGQGIEFRPRRGPERRLEWKDVRWVKWRQGHFALLADGRRLSLERGLIAEAEWERVRGRVESILSGRFDLTVKPSPAQELNWLRVLALSVPSGLLSGLLLYTAASSPRLLPTAFGALCVIMMGSVLFCFALLYRESERHNPTWRAAKSKAGDWDDWSV